MQNTAIIVVNSQDIPPYLTMATRIRKLCSDNRSYKVLRAATKDGSLVKNLFKRKETIGNYTAAGPSVGQRLAARRACRRPRRVTSGPAEIKGTNVPDTQKFTSCFHRLLRLFYGFRNISLGKPCFGHNQAKITSWILPRR